MSPPALPGIFGSLAPILNSYGYLAVGGLLFLEDFGVPLPGETILIAAAVYAGAGQLNIVVVVVVGFLAAVAGDNVGFAIGHFGGRKLVLRFGRYVFLTEARLDKAEGFFTRHGGKVVTIARFIEGLRQANGIVAGLAKMPWRRFCCSTSSARRSGWGCGARSGTSPVTTSTPSTPRSNATSCTCSSRSPSSSSLCSSDTCNNRVSPAAERQQVT